MADFRILYLVPDLSDPAVAKRIAMLRDGGAIVRIAGFRRTAEAPATIAGSAAIDLGQTHNGKFAQRILAVIRTLFRLRAHEVEFATADLILARNLEMLALGVRGRALPPTQPVLVYECLDVHRLLLNEGPAGRALRRLEGWLSERAAALITSSPAFVHSYFETRSRVQLPTLLVENKVYAPSLAPPFAVTPRLEGPPWRIGWFGAIRCRDSLRILSNLVRQNEGKVEVIIRGRPAYDQFEDFDTAVAHVPNLRFLGPYKNPDDLEAIYGEIHFTWAIDRFESGLNSSWLLPNRLYEGGLFGSVPLAEASVEIGRFLERLNIGVALPDPLEATLGDFFSNLTAEKYRALEAASAAVPQETWLCDRDECAALNRHLRGLKGTS